MGIEEILELIKELRSQLNQEDGTVKIGIIIALLEAYKSLEALNRASIKEAA